MPDLFPFYACFGGFLCLVVPVGLVRLTFCAARDRFTADEAQFLPSDDSADRAV